MDIFIAILLFAVGSLVVVKGADLFVSASSWMSDVTGASKVLIGVTLVAMATSGPELFVSLIAAIQGQADMSMGNIVGSHLCNFGLGFSLIAAFRPMKNTDKLYLPNGAIMIAAAAILYLICFGDTLNVFHGLGLMALFGVFTYINIRFDQGELENVATAREKAAENHENIQQESAEAEQSAVASEQKMVKRAKKPTNKKEILLNILKFVIGLAGIIVGSKIMVDNATVLARAMGVSEMFIGLTIVAVGTSLPEIVTTIVAIIKKEDDLGIGNIIGSCIFNNTFILAVAAFVTGGLAVSSSLLVDMPIAIGMMLVAVVPTVLGKRLYRWQGVMLFAMYVGYATYLGVGLA